MHAAAMLLVGVTASRCWSEDQLVRVGTQALIGVSIGWPIGVNGLIGVETPRVGARVSGAYWGRALSGVELELSTPFFRMPHARGSINVVVGTNRWDLDFEPGPLELTSYAGMGVRVEWRGLFLSQGPCYRLNTEHAPQGIGHRSRFIWHMAAGYAFAFGV
jgi:hypothetical protein